MSEAPDTPPPRAGFRSAWRRPVVLLAWTLTALVVFSLSFVPLRLSQDEWWHLKTGKWTVENGYTLPRTDIFTHTAVDYEWHNHEWLSQVAMYLLYRWGEERVIGGWRAVILAKSLVLVATYLLLGLWMWRRGAAISGRPTASLAAAVFMAILAAAIGRRTFWPRPPVLTYLFLVFFLYVLWAHRAGSLRHWHLIVLPLLLPLWANLHGGFVLGCIAIAAWCAGGFVEAFVARRRDDQTDRRVLLRQAMALVAAGTLCGLGTMTTPWGWDYLFKLHAMTQRVMGNAELVSRLSELEPPRLERAWAFAFLAALLTAGFLALTVRALLRRRPAWPPLGETIFVLFLFQQATSHVRHLPLFGLAGPPLAAWMLARVISTCGPRAQRLLTAAFATGAIVTSAALLLSPAGEAVALATWLRSRPSDVEMPPSFLERNLALLRGGAVEPGAYPERAVNFILSKQPPGKMYNRDHLAGYLIWRLSPEHYRVFTDMRFDIFGGDFLLDELSVINAWPDGLLGEQRLPVRDWRTVLDAWDVNWLFVETVNPIHQVLLARNNLGWALIYLDRQIAVWLRRGPRSKAWLDRYGAVKVPDRVREDALRHCLEERWLPLPEPPSGLQRQHAPESRKP